MSAILTEKELAARWQLSPRTVRLKRAKGDAPAVCGLVKGSPRYRLEDVLAYEQSVTQGAMVPEAARRAMLKAAALLNVIVRWDMKPATREQVEAMRDELRRAALPGEGA